MEINHQFIGNPESKKIIVFLHEGLGSIKQWKTYPAQLCEALNCYGFVYDRRGYGLSPGSLTNRKTDYLHQGAEELHEIIEHFISQQYDIHLYGHSDGGSIALIYAAKYPLMIKSIVTEAAHVFVEEITLKGVADALPLFSQGKFEGLKKYHGDRYKEVFMAWNNIWLNPAFEKWDITDLLSGIIVDQLVIQGKDDQYGTLKQVQTIVSLTTGKSITHTPNNCGHAPHKENAKETLLKVIQFINEH